MTKLRADTVPLENAMVRAIASLVALAGLLWSAGCASQVDLTSIRREQRMMARRIADQRADLDRLNTEVSRLRRQVGGAAYGGTAPYGAPTGADPYAQGAYPPGQGPAGGAAPQGQGYPAGAGYGAPDAAAGGYAAGNAAPGGYAVGGAPAQAEVAATPTGSKLQTDMGRGSDVEYQQGLQHYASGDYQRSVQSLRNYVSRNPRDPLVPVAQYWIGEAYYSQGKYNESILAFNEILVSWPESDRKPGALLRQADAFARTGDKIDARMILQKLIEDHPASPEAAEAKEQLRSLGG